MCTNLTSAGLAPGVQACTTVSQLRDLTNLLRQHRAAAAGGNASSAAFAWVPAEIRLLPFHAPEVESAVGDGNVWVLAPPAARLSSGGQGAEGARCACSTDPGFVHEAHTALIVLRPSSWLSTRARQEDIWHASAQAAVQQAWHA